MARGNNYWGAAKRGFTQTQTQTVVQVQEKFECAQCKKERTRDCFSKSALKKRLHQDLVSMQSSSSLFRNTNCSRFASTAKTITTRQQTRASSMRLVGLSRPPRSMTRPWCGTLRRVGSWFVPSFTDIRPVMLTVCLSRSHRCLAGTFA